MSDVLTNDDLDALAAEYVLGTLDAEERKGATALLEVDHAFRGTVRIWEHRLGELHLMVEPVDPEAKIWERIRSKLGIVTQMPLAVPATQGETLPGDAPSADATLPDAKPPQAGDAVSAATNSTDASKPGPAFVEVEWPESKAESGSPAPTPPPTPTPAPDPDESPARSADSVPRGNAPPPMLRPRGAPATDNAPPPRRATGRGWKIGTALSVMVALGLAALIGAWRFFPERLPPQLRASTVLHLGEAERVSPPPIPPRRPPPPFDE